MEQPALNAVLLNLPRSAKRLVVLVVDASLCVLALWLALYLRLGEFVYLNQQNALAIVASLGLALPIFLLNGLYRAIFRYSGWPALMTVAKSVIIYGVIYASIFTAIGVAGTPRTVGIIQPILLFLLIGASRGLAYYWLGGEYRRRVGGNEKERVLVYGAGSAGRQIAAALVGNREMKIVGFLDDDARLAGQVLNGLTIYPAAKMIEQSLILKVTTILLAIPSANQKRRHEIIERIREAKLLVRTLPSITEIAQGKVSINDIKELEIDDLLGRSPVEPDIALLKQTITAKTVLITGAGGSIGSELCRQIIRLEPHQIVLVDHSEFALYQIYEELLAIQEKNNLGVGRIVAALGSVRDQAFVSQTLKSWNPDTVYHAAAYKHVPLVEENSVEGIRNNVLGTKIMAEAAIEMGAKNFVLISTDKAVRPTNVMGASKRIAELLLQALSAEQTRTCLSMVRFGNVLGSSGSVVPKFRQQIADGGPVSVTHPDVTRYFMTIPEAAQLVIQSAAMAKGGEVFLLDMGEPIRIADLARRMIELSGLTVRDDKNEDGDIDISFTGLRPGEKLYEELLLGTNPTPTTHPRIMKGEERAISTAEVEEVLQKIEGFIADKNLNVLRDFVIGLAQD